MQRSNSLTRFTTFVVIALTLTVVVGCGGKKGGGQSLTAQYEKAMKLGSPDAKSKQLLKIGEQQAKAGDSGGANKSFIAAGSAAEEITLPRLRAEILSEVAKAEGQRGKGLRAEEMLKKARDAYNAIEAVHDRIPAIANCAEVFALHLDSAAKGKGELLEAEDLIASITEPQLKIQAAGRIAAAYFTINREKDGVRVLDSTTASAEAIADARQKADALLQIASILAEAKQTDKGKEILASAITAIGTIEDVQSKAFALTNLAESQLAFGEKTAARASLDEASTLAEKVEASLRGDLTDRIERVKGKI
ncbi:MAG: tetratricopeptide (TPR) repeat protein [Pirellulaceae bacterium]|jgi:tetratricopeptide (TPR) repeat protein